MELELNTIEKLECGTTESSPECREFKSSHDDVRQALLAAIKRAGSQRAFASANGFSKQYINNIVNQHRSYTISAKLANALGYKRQLIYRSISEDLKLE